MVNVINQCSSETGFVLTTSPQGIYGILEEYLMNIPAQSRSEESFSSSEALYILSAMTIKGAKKPEFNVIQSIPPTGFFGR